MDNIIGLITSGHGDFGPLTATRPAYMLPFGCRYRLIDFALSTIVNNHISNVALYAGSMLRSTIDHIGNGKPWDLNRRFGGLTIFPTVYNAKYNRSDEILNIYDSLSFYEDNREEQIFFIDPMVLTKIDVAQAYAQHVNNNADITIIYKTIHDAEGQYLNTDKLTFHEDQSLKNIGINLGTQDTFHMYLGMGFIKKSVFMEMVKHSMETEDAYSLKTAILSGRNRYLIQTYSYEGRFGVVRDVSSYFDANLSILNRESYRSLFFENGIIFTKNKDEPSTIYYQHAHVSNSLLANGCMIDGTLINSILFRGVTVGSNAIVKNSILMEGVEIEEDAVVINCILDKGTIVRKGVSLVGSTSNPYTTAKKQVISR